MFNDSVDLGVKEVLTTVSNVNNSLIEIQSKVINYSVNSLFLDTLHNNDFINYFVLKKIIIIIMTLFMC